MEFLEFSVGTKYPKYQTFSDGYRVNYTDSGMFLEIFMCNISPKELEQFQAKEEFKLRLTVIDDVAYFLFKFGDMPWSDAPFSPRIYVNGGIDVKFPMPDPGTGLPLLTLVYESTTGELKHIRQIGLGHELTVMFCAWAEKAAKTPLTNAEYQRRVNDTYSKYTSDELAKIALLGFELFRKRG